MTASRLLKRLYRAMNVSMPSLRPAALRGKAALAALCLSMLLPAPAALAQKYLVGASAVTGQVTDGIVVPPAALPIAVALTVTYTPSTTLVAGQPYRVTWTSKNAVETSFSCTAGGSGYTESRIVASNGYIDGTASAAWVGYPSTCVWFAEGNEDARKVTKIITTTAGATTPPTSGLTPEALSAVMAVIQTILLDDEAPAAPTISVVRTPSPMIAGEAFTLSWSTENATALRRVCTAGGSGFVANEALAGNGDYGDTAPAGWVGYPSTCTWTATGAGGSVVHTETMQTKLAPPRIEVSRVPSPMIAGQPYTLSWRASNATSLSRVCASSGTGYAVSDAPATSGSSAGSAPAAWVGYPSSCTWTARGPGGSVSHVEAMSTVAGAAVDTVTYIHTDGLGSPAARTDRNGLLLSRTRYEPYGLTAAGATPTIGFTGHVNDADTGLVYMQQRYYDPVAARFLSIDPIVTDANTGGMFNRYYYANNNPYKYIDPDGREFKLAPTSSKAFRSDWKKMRNYLRKGGAGGVMKEIDRSKAVVHVSESYGSATMSYNSDTKTINVDPLSGLQTTGGDTQTPALGLLHEASHALQDIKNPEQMKSDGNTSDEKFGNKEEKRAIINDENPAAISLKEPTRDDHGGTPVPVKCSTCKD